MCSPATVSENAPPRIADKFTTYGQDGPIRRMFGTEEGFSDGSFLAAAADNLAIFNKSKSAIRAYWMYDRLRIS